MNKVKFCNRGKHNLENPKNVRTNKKGSVICKPCDSEYQHNKSGIVASLPVDTPSMMKDYKEPLREVPNGFGYMGTISYDKSQTYTQCHSCGVFYRFLGKHVTAAHSLTSDEYKEKYGIDKKSSLLATNTRSNAVEHWASLSDAERTKRLERLREMAKLGNRAKQGLPRQTRLEWHNKRGSCPDQIVDKILALHKKLGKTPTQKDFEKAHNRGLVKTATVHFGGWNEAVKQAGLVPNTRHRGTAWYTEEQLLESLRDFKKIYGREPYSGEARTGILVASSSAYRRAFGTWLKAKQAAFNN